MTARRHYSVTRNGDTTSPFITPAEAVSLVLDGYTVTTLAGAPVTATAEDLAVLEGPQRPTLVTRDGAVLAEVATADDAWMWLQRHQGQSVDWAVRYEGYRVVSPSRF